MIFGCTQRRVPEDKPAVPAPIRNLVKPFSIAGFVLAEIYMLFTVLAPNAPVLVFYTAPVPVPVLLTSVPAPLWAKIARIAACSLFFGPFGALVGMGVGLLVTGLVNQIRNLLNGSKTHSH